MSNVKLKLWPGAMLPELNVPALSVAVAVRATGSLLVQVIRVPT